MGSTFFSAPKICVEETSATVFFLKAGRWRMHESLKQFLGFVSTDFLTDSTINHHFSPFGRKVCYGFPSILLFKSTSFKHGPKKTNPGRLQRQSATGWNLGGEMLRNDDSSSKRLRRCTFLETNITSHLKTNGWKINFLLVKSIFRDVCC